MKLSEFKSILENSTKLIFTLPNETLVPSHFHVTEVGQVTKHFIDCGGTVRNEKTVSFQLWEATDFEHRLAPQKLMSIISLSEKTLGLQDAEIEVEYQSNTIGKYGIAYCGDGKFMLTSKQTNCLASDKCGIPPQKQKINLVDLTKTTESCCTPGSGCC